MTLPDSTIGLRGAAQLHTIGWYWDDETKKPTRQQRFIVIQRYMKNITITTLDLDESILKILLSKYQNVKTGFFYDQIFISLYFYLN